MDFDTPPADRSATPPPTAAPAPPRRPNGVPEPPGSAIHAAIERALEQHDAEAVLALVRLLRYADLADLIEILAPEQRRRLIDIIRPSFDPNVLHELDEEVAHEVAGQLGTADLAAAIARLESDDALYLIEHLDEPSRRAVLEAIPAALRALLEEGLAFPEDSAGRLMQRHLIAVPVFWMVGRTIDFMRESTTLPEDFYDIFVVDPRHRPIGTVPLSRLLRAGRETPITAIMEEPRLVPIPATLPQEEVADRFRREDLVSAPVVDGGGRLIGVITVDDVVDVIDEAAEEDLLRLGGVLEGDLHASWLKTAKRRQSWLLITLFNTILASAVISQFQASIEQLVALAVLMPIVAAMGGNAGMQVVTVTVRALATKELTPANRRRVIAKEVAVGLANGVVFASIMGLIAGLWFRDTGLGLVLAGAMVFNMCWAGLAGTLIPLLLARLKIDPAVAAGPFLTTTTDVLGFFVFLGLAATILLG